MRVNPNRQTLILAGETPPRRSVAGSGRSAANSTGSTSGTQRITVISARLDAVVTRSEYTPVTQVVAYDSVDPSDFDDTPALPVSSASPAMASIGVRRGSYIFSANGAPFGGASAYAQTQALADRRSIIDTYA